jgi:uncharacterized protein (TIGR00369 family)
MMRAPMRPADDLSPTLNAHLDGWNAAMGLRFVRATADEVIAECTVGPQHLQPYGLVHGGVYAGLIETVTSVGAALWGMAQGLSVVGLDNHTSFLRGLAHNYVTGLPQRRALRAVIAVGLKPAATCAKGPSSWAFWDGRPTKVGLSQRLPQASA